MTQSSPPHAAARTQRVELIAVQGLPDFEPGDDLASILMSSLAASGERLASGDVVVVAQKVVSKCENAYAEIESVRPGLRALALARATGKDARLVEVVLADTSEVLRAREGILIVANRGGHVMANAGVDSSNIATADASRVLRLPEDPDRSALQLKERLEHATGSRLAVVINDSWGRAWRNGTVGHAVGAAGIAALWDRRGEPDMFGRQLRVTEIGLADEIAAAASLVMGAAGERQPVVIVRGFDFPTGEGGAKALVRDRAKDLFR